MSRVKPPDRRLSWTQTVKIENQRFYLTCGETEDGKLIEIFLEAHKHGTFSRGILDALARMTSIALQCGAPVADVVYALRGLNFPPNEFISGSLVCTSVTSIADWIAQELSAAYLSSPDSKESKPKSAGHISESWRSGA